MLENGYIIRELTFDEAENCCQLYARSMRKGYKEFLSGDALIFMENYLEKKGFSLDERFTYKIGGYKNDILCGFVTTTDDRLSNLFIDPKHFGTGLAKMLLFEAMSRIGDKGWLICRVGNDRAYAFYKKHSLRYCGIEESGDTDSMGLNIPNHIFCCGV